MDFSDDGPVQLLPDASLRQHAAYLAAHPGLATGVSLPCGGCRGLFTARAFQPGEVLLREAAVLWQLEDGSGRYLYNPAATAREAVPTIAHNFAPWHGEAPTARLPLRELLYQAMRCNSWGCGGGRSRGLFPVLCLANSSCAPNCSSEEEEEEEEGGGAAGAAAAAGGGGAAGAAPVYTLRARRALAAGEEVTVSYVPRAWPKQRRAEELAAAWGFACACPRCAAPHDDAQVGRCSACGSGRVFLPDDPAAQAAAPCADCGAASSAAALAAQGADGAAWAAAAAAAAACGTTAALAAHVAGLLAHPVLAPDDARVLTALNAALGRAHALAGAAGGSGEAQALFEGILGELCRVCARSGFAALADLGIEVEEEPE